MAISRGGGRNVDSIYLGDIGNNLHCVDDTDDINGRSSLAVLGDNFRKMRINRFLAEAGVSSRRGADKLISEGRVKLDGKTASLGDDVIEGVRVEVDGKRVGEDEKKVYYLYHKLPGELSTVRDDRGRRTIMERLGIKERVYPVGRLDKETTGLVMLTNDGDIAYRMTHPKFEVSKVYELEVNGWVNGEQMRELKSGVMLEDGKTAPAKVEGVREGLLRVTITEGKKRQIRRMCDAVGIDLVRLSRVAMAGLTLDGLKMGDSRKLTGDEVKNLKKLFDKELP